MMRSLFSGVAGLKTHQTKMDVVGNNIANVNTAGFKKSTVTFNEMLNQTLRGASSPQGNLGGTNPVQIGLGVTLGSIDVVHSPGSPQSTGRSLDMAIEGEGYFLVGDSTDNFYTRAGNFGFDSSNNLVNSSGMKVKGWVASVDSNNTFTLDNTQSASPINLTALASSKIMQATTEMEVAVNLDSRAKTPMIQTVDAIGVSGDNAASAGSLSEASFNLGTSAIIDDSYFTISDGTTSLTYAQLQTEPGSWNFDSATGEFEITDGSGIFGTLSGTGNLTVNYNNAVSATYTSPTADGDDLALATDLAPVVIGIGEELIFNENFSITDGTNTISYADMQADPTKWAIDETTGDLTIKSGTINGKTFSGSTPVEVNYDKPDPQSLTTTGTPATYSFDLGDSVVLDESFKISDGTNEITYAQLQTEPGSWNFDSATGEFEITDGSGIFATLSGTDDLKVTFNNMAPETFSSPNVTGDIFAAASSVNPVKINIGEGVVLNTSFALTDGTNRISYEDLKADPTKWELNSSTGELTIKSGTINGKTLAGTNLIDVEYDEANYQTSFKVFDNQGGAHDLSVSFRKTGANTWESNYSLDGNVVSINGEYNKEIVYKTSGQVDDTVPGNSEFLISTGFDSSLGLDDLNIKVDLSNMKQVASEYSTMSLEQNGFEPGSLQKISVNASGEIVGTFSNGQNLVLAQVAVATFNNPSGLEKTGNTMFKASKNSGVAEIGTPGSSGRGNLKPETLEMSNVDLSQEFVNMIITQRGFQANSRIITTSDEMLQELVNLKR